VDIILILFGGVLVTYGWYWGGITESRTTAYALGAGSLLFGLTFAFTGGGSGGAFQPVEGAILAFGTVFAFLAAANAWNESSQDRTYGMFALLGTVGAILALMAFNEIGDVAGQYSYAQIMLGATFALHFISASLVPENRGFKAFVGWLTLIVGAALVYFGFAETLGSGFEPM
jgi:hypothetical protein